MGFLKRLFGLEKKKKEEPQKQPEAPQEKEMQEVRLEDVEKELDELEEEKAPVAEEKKEEEPEKEVYHIKKHPDGWQVIKEGAEKAYRVFPYQKDAIEFADKEGLEYLVHRTDGTLRK